jgi:putative phosphoribosyl transferase
MERVEVRIAATASVALPGTLTVPDAPAGVVLFAHGSGSGRASPRNVWVADRLHEAGLASLLFDLLEPGEAQDRRNVFDVGLLATRLAIATDHVTALPRCAGLPVGYFGASTGAAAALIAAAERGDSIHAIVSRGGRPDLAGPALPLVRAPTLLIVGSRDVDVLTLNRDARSRLTCPGDLIVVPGATHLFEEPGTLEEVASLAEAWFLRHFRSGMGPRSGGANARAG